MMIAFSSRITFLNFLKTFLNFLMIRWVIFSMMMILQIFAHSTRARVQILLLIAEMKTFELIVTKANESRFVYLHSVIFLAIMSIDSLSRTSTWTKIQWMWISQSHFSSLRISVCNKYCSDCFLKYWIAWITIWQFVKIVIDRFLKWYFVTFKIKLSFTISSK
jgi:hypothetical protein